MWKSILVYRSHFVSASFVICLLTRATVFTNQMQGSSRSHLSLARFPTLQVLHYVFILNSHWLFRFRIGCIGYFDFALLKRKSLDLVYG